jgi:exodeoxyribonuclease VII small subunit
MAKELTLKDLVEAEANPDLNNLAFEKGLKLLEELVQGVESGALPLEKSIRAYERGAMLMNYLKGQLEGAEQKLKVLQQPGKDA